MKKRQHYVPRFYLKNFARKINPKTYQIQCFDKFEFEQFEATISDVSVEKFFYDIQEPTIIENILSFLESEFARVLNKIIREKSIDNLTGTDFTIMSCYIFIQHERTKSARIRNTQIAELVYKDLFENKPELGLPLLEALSEDYKKWLFESRGKKAQIKLMFSLFSEIEGAKSVNPAKEIFKLDWILGKSNTKFEFYTSDHPIFIHNPDRKEVPLQGYGQYAFYSSGVRIYFPISPELCLIIYDGKTYTNAKKLGTKLWIDNDELDWINTQIIAEAYRWVYSKGKDFQFVRECLKRFPVLKDPFRNRLS